MKNRIRQLRLELGLNQTQFGEKLGITPSAVSKIESGDREPAETTIRLMVKEFHVNAVWLTSGEGDMFEKVNTDALVDKYMAGESEWAKSIMKSFARLPDDEWYKFRDMIERIKKEGHP